MPCTSDSWRYSTGCDCTRTKRRLRDNARTRRTSQARYPRWLRTPRRVPVCSCCDINPKRGGISVVLQNQSFDAVIAWIADLEQTDHVAVKQISVDAQSQPGMVNARITLI